MDRSVEDADSTDWVVPPITIRLASCDEWRCHEPCTATAHGCPTLLRTDLFETVIECTATDHVIFSRCIYISFHGNLLPLA